MHQMSIAYIRNLIMTTLWLSNDQHLDDDWDQIFIHLANDAKWILQNDFTIIGIH